MPRKLIKRLLPDPDRVKNHQSLRFLGQRLHDPNLWHLNRYSVSTAVFMPAPGQMLAAAALALWWRANLPISVVLVWVTNPVTMPPVFYFSYRLGATLLHRPTLPMEFQPTWEWLSERLVYIWEPLLLGSVVGGLFFGLLGAALVRVLWRINVLHRWRQRRQRRQAK
jgi:uncharacterized protein (DUF2062 family)